MCFFLKECKINNTILKIQGFIPVSAKSRREHNFIFPLFLINKIKGKDMTLDWYPLLRYSEPFLLLEEKPD